MAGVCAVTFFKSLAKTLCGELVIIVGGGDRVVHQLEVNYGTLK